MNNRRYLKNLGLALVFGSSFAPLHAAGNPEAARWEQEARTSPSSATTGASRTSTAKPTPTRSSAWIYAQAEDDFNRVETNYINAMGRLAEAEGESKIYQDLRMKLFIDPAALKKQYAASPAWLKTLMNAFADGLNYYLSKHPEVKPRVIQHFEPWMALSFTEGSIGGDIERVNLNQLEAFYGKESSVTRARCSARRFQRDPPSPRGSNGMAIAPSNTAAHHALLLINPHTSFFFRSELQMVSDEGLNAYGAVTWGQFFIYQGFNERAGWMHTSSGVDAVDEYLETVEKKGDRFYYKYGSEERPVIAGEITVPYKTASGMAEKKFTVYRTHHGPVIREANGKWVSIRLMQEPIKALMQSYTRTKATDYKSFRQTMELKANSSNNTIFADADGDIAYFHGNFIPRRDTSFDWTKPVDGSNPATEWHGLLSVDETAASAEPQERLALQLQQLALVRGRAEQPEEGGLSRLRRERRANPRAACTPSASSRDKKDFTLDSLIAAAYDSYLPWFEKPIPALRQGLGRRARLRSAESETGRPDRTPAQLGSSLGRRLPSPLRSRSSGARRSAAASVGDARKRGISVEDYVGTKLPPSSFCSRSPPPPTNSRPISEPGRRRGATSIASSASPATSSSPSTTPAPSIPVGFTSSLWGSLASFGARAYPGTKKWYGTSGNSFVAVVEFGDKVRAKAVTAGGESGHPASPHFNDRGQALQHRRLARGLLLPLPTQGPHGARIPSRKLIRRRIFMDSSNAQHNTIFQPSAIICRQNWRIALNIPSHRCWPASFSCLYLATSHSPTGTKASTPKYLARCFRLASSFPLELSTLVRKAAVDALDHRSLLQNIWRQ